MTVTCKLCGELLKSYQLVKENALQEVSMLIVRHIEHKHPDKAREVIEAHVLLIQTIPWFLMMRRFIGWNSLEEDFIEKNFREWEEKIAKYLEFDVKVPKTKLEIVQ